MLQEFLVRLNQSGYKELLKGSSVGFVLKAAGILFAQIFAIVVGRTLGADAYGAFGLSLSIITIFSILSTAGLDIGLLKFVASNNKTGNKQEISHSYLTSLIIAVPLSTVISYLSFLYSPAIAGQIFDKAHLTPYFKIASLGILPLTIIKMNGEALRGFKEIKEYVFLKYAGTHLFAVSLLVLFYFIFIQNDIIVIVSYVSGLVLLSLLSFYLILKKIRFSRYEFELERLKKMVYLSVPLMLAGSLMFVKGWIDTIMVGYFMTNSDVGIYNIALKVASLTSIVLTAVNIIAAPQFAESQDDEDDLQKNIQRASRLIFMFSFPVMLVIFLLPDFILGLFGAEFTSGKSALFILLGGHLINTMAGSVGNVMKMTGKEVALQNITFITTGLGIVLNYTLIPIIGIDGAAVSTMTTMIFWNVGCSGYLKMKYDLKTYYNPITDVKRWIRSSS